MNKEEKAILISSTLNKSTNTSSNNAMKNYELLVDQNRILNELLDKVNNLDLNIQYIFKLCKDKEIKEDANSSGWFY